MLGRQGPLANGQGSLEKRLCLQRLALVDIDHCQVVKTERNGRIVDGQGRFPDAERPLKQCLQPKECMWFIENDARTCPRLQLVAQWKTYRLLLDALRSRES